MHNPPTPRTASLRTLLVAAVLALGAARPAAAGVIVQVPSFSGTSFVDALRYQEFDTTLGTLDSVQVSILGTTTVTVRTAVRLGGFGTPIAHNYSFTLEQDFFPGATGRGFGFTSDALHFFNGLASGAGETQLLVHSFSYGFAFTEITDLVGFALPGSTGGIPPASVAGTRDDFLPLSPLVTGLPIETLMTYQPTAITQGVSILSAETLGSMTLIYDYTPFPVAAPEPSSLALLALGLAVLLGRRR